MNERDQIINMLIEEKGGSREEYETLMDSIAYHESAGTMDPAIRQIGGGPGRGKYQFEEGKNAGGITAARRLKRYYDRNKVDSPTWLNRALMDDSLNVTNLTGEQQDILFLANMREHPKADLANLMSGKESITEFWSKNHWAGKDEDKEERVKSFNDSYIQYKAESTQEVEGRKFNNENSHLAAMFGSSTESETRPISGQSQQDVFNNAVRTTQAPNEGMQSLVERVQQSRMNQQSQQSEPMASKELNRFNTGDTHERNRLGGIPQGNNTSVEQGETSFNLSEGKFIFSDRIGLAGTKLGGKLQQVSNSYNDQFQAVRGGYIDPRTGRRVSDNTRNSNNHRADLVKKKTYVQTQMEAEDANEKAMAQSKKQAKTELAKDQVFEDMQKVYDHPLGQPGMFSPMGAEDLILSGIGKGIKSISNKIAKNAGKKLSSFLTKEEMTTLYRVQEKNFDINTPTLSALEKKVASGEAKWYEQNILNNPERKAEIASRDAHYGQWFENDPKRLEYYLDDKLGDVDILKAKVPKKDVDKYNVGKSGSEDAKKWSLSPDTEFILPREDIMKAKKYGRDDWNKLIREHTKNQKNNFSSEMDWGGYIGGAIPALGFKAPQRQMDQGGPTQNKPSFEEIFKRAMAGDKDPMRSMEQEVSQQPQQPQQPQIQQPIQPTQPQQPQQQFNTFNEAFKNARDTLGANQIFEFEGKQFGTNLAGEEFKPSAEVLEKTGLLNEKVINNLEKQNKEVNSPFTSKETTKLQQNKWQDWEKIKNRNGEIKKMSDADKIINYHSSKSSSGSTDTEYTVKAGDNLSTIAKKHGTTAAQLQSLNGITNPNQINEGQKLNIKGSSGDKYLIVDKKNARMHLYQGGTLLDSFEVGVGSNKGDAQTTTKVKGSWVDWAAGNYSTGAGIYTISNVDPANKQYYGLPAFNMENENGIEVSTAIHGTPHARRKSFDDGNLENNRMSYGCVNGKCQDLKDLYSKYNVGKGDKVYILPEDEGNEFEIVDGKPVFRVDSKNREKYLTYTDKRGNTQKGQGANYTTKTLNYAPIKIDVNNKLFEGRQAEKVAIPFAKSLEDNKKDIMKAAKIPSDIYNEIVKVAFGILGTETNFGEEHSFVGNLARSLNKVRDEGNNSSPDYKKKQEGFPMIGDAMIKAGTYFKSPSLVGHGVKAKGAKSDSNSVGLTQIRFAYLNADEKKALKQVGITENIDFMDPTKAAIGTAVVLGIRYNQQLSQEEKGNIMENLPKKWNRRKNYSSRVKEASEYINLKQFIDNE